MLEAVDRVPDQIVEQRVDLGAVEPEAETFGSGFR